MNNTKSTNLSLPPSEQPDLTKQLSTPFERRTTLSIWLNEQVREDVILEIELLALAFGIGIQDATTYPDYSCFASNQTGNTVLFAIGIAGIAKGAVSLSNTAISLSLFILGGWCAGQLGNMIGPRRRAWLLFSSFIQTTMVFAAAAIQYTTKLEKSGPMAYLVLALLAFSSSAQVAMSRGLKITEITTAMATAAYVDIVTDPNLFSRTNRRRNRRAAFLFTLTAGSFAGAYIHRAVNSALSLLVSAIVKAIVTIALGFNMKRELNDEKKEAVGILG